MRCVGSVALPSSLSSPQRMPRKFKTRRFVPYKIASRLACIKMQMQACLWDEVAENLTKAEQLMRGGSSAAAMLQVGLVRLLRPDPQTWQHGSLSRSLQGRSITVFCAWVSSRDERCTACEACCAMRVVGCRWTLSSRAARGAHSVAMTSKRRSRSFRRQSAALHYVCLHRDGACPAESAPELS